MRSWATPYVEKLRRGERVEFRPRGNSMVPRIRSGQLVTVRPLGPGEHLEEGTVALAKVGGRWYLHLVRAITVEKADGNTKYLIGNNRGGINGWADEIAGLCIKVRDR